MQLPQADEDFNFNDSHYKRIGGTGESEEKTKEWLEYRKKWNEYPKKFIVNDFPLHLDIELTNACNLRCKMCFRYVMNESEGFMSFDLFKKIINESEKYNLPAVNITWRGESLLHKDVIEMIKYAKEHRVIDLRMNTNATLINESMAKRLIDSGVDRIIISLDGDKKETYEKIRVGANFEKVIENIERLIELRNKKGKKPFIEIQAINIKQTYDEFEGLLKRWGSKANKITKITYRNPVGKEKDEFRTEKKPQKLIPCERLWQRLTITWSGKVHACCGDNQGKLIIGDVIKDNLYGLWHSNNMNSLRKLHSELKGEKIEACRECEFNKE